MMKKLLLFLLAGTTLGMAACSGDANGKGTGGKDSTGAAMNNASSTSSKDAKDERNKAVVMQSVQAMHNHDLVAAFKDVADDFMDYGDGSTPPAKGKDSVMAMIKQWLPAFSEGKDDNLKAVADGDWVVVWGDWSGTWKGDLMGQKATGKSYKVKDAQIFRMNDDGKITEHHALSTGPAKAMQMGMKME